MSRALDPSVSRSAWTAALVALLNAHCGSTAATPDAQSAADASELPDVLSAPDVLPAPDVLSAPDVPLTPDAGTMNDVPAMTDVAASVDVGVDSGPTDVPAPPPQALLGLLRSDVGTHYRVGSGVVTPGGMATWNDCGTGFSLIGRDFQPNGFWLCATSPLTARRFFVGNTLGGVSTFWSLQRGNVTARGAGTRDQCAAGSSLIGRSGSGTDGFWVCMDGEVSGPHAQAWEFNVDDTLAGWTTNENRAVTIRGGRITYVDPGPDPYLVSPDNLDLDASNARVYVGLRSGPASVEARLYFVPSTLGAGAFSAERSVVARTVPGDTASREIVFDMSTHPEWRGTMRQLRLDPGTVPGTYEIDYIRVGPPRAPGFAGTSWTFDTDAQGWTGRGTVTTVTGILAQAININDAQLTSPPLSQSARQTKLRMRLHARIPESNGEVFFETSTAPGIVQARSVPFAIVPDDTGLREYVADLSTHPQYTGTLTRIRVDFGSSSRGSVEIDWIGFDD